LEIEPFVQIDADEAEELISQGATVIDVRQPYEFGHDHIEEAVLVPIDGLFSFSVALGEQNLPKDAPIVFVCEMGQRSAAASEVAAIAGYRKVYNLSGGMNMWRYEGKPVIKGS
jgi:adenylyltransferase/sulfurtransferase